MKILIIDSNSTNQARYAERLYSLPSQDVETLDLHIMLLEPDTYHEHLDIMDLVVLGSGLGDSAISIAKNIKERDADKNIILFVDRDKYNGPLIRKAQYVGVRRVMFDLSDDLEFLQELYAIDADFRRSGKLNFGKIIAVVSPKGGAGTTTLTAALGELADIKGHKSLLWDMDSNTQDLSRSLALFGKKQPNYLEWMDNFDKLALKSFLSSTTSISENVDLLSLPEDSSEIYDLYYHQEGTTVLQKILDLARYNYKNIIIDLAEISSPGAEAVLSLSDEIVVITGECALSITACELFLQKAKKILGNLDGVRILTAGDRHTISEVKESIKNIKLSETAWLPALPADQYAWSWPGSGQTLYSMGSKDTKNAIMNIAEDLDIITSEENEQFQVVTKSRVVSIPFFNKRRKALPYHQKEEQETTEIADIMHRVVASAS